MSVLGNIEVPMRLIVDTLGVLYVIAMFQALLIAFYLFIQRKGIAKSRKILALLMVDFAFSLTGTFLLLFLPHWRYIYYAHLATLSVFIAPPLLYFYYRTLIEQDFILSYRSLIQVVPIRQCLSAYALLMHAKS